MNTLASASLLANSLAAILLLGTGFIYGGWTNRWRQSADLTSLAASLDTIPMVLGDWKGVDAKLSDQERAMSGAVGYVSRRYTNSTLGVSFSVLLLCGLPGNLSAHTPDVCYPGAGYELTPPSQLDHRYGPGDSVANFHAALAKRGGASPSTLQILWSWKTPKGWVAPKDPRWSLGSETALCKLYVIREAVGLVEDRTDEHSKNFLNILIPELDRHLVFSSN